MIMIFYIIIIIFKFQFHRFAGALSSTYSVVAAMLSSWYNARIARLGKTSLRGYRSYRGIDVHLFPSEAFEPWGFYPTVKFTQTPQHIYIYTRTRLRVCIYIYIFIKS